MKVKDIKSPLDLKFLSIEELKELGRELREIIIERVSLNGGHLASNLGVIELTLALHYVFNSPEDKFIWDVGHQSYPHKILTGRYDKFHTLRQFGGISGFPKMNESPHDPYGAGHSSTSISAALGILEGRDRIGKNFKVISVIGDGAMTGGLAFEGLNHAGHIKKDLIVILNDNEMSISKNVGALSSYLTRIMSGNLYRRVKQETRLFMELIPKVGEHFSKLAQKTEEAFKHIFAPGMLFEELGFTYVGPIDGHDIEKLIDVLKLVKNNTSPILVHLATKKGKGYEFSEKNPCFFHGVAPFEPVTGETKKSLEKPSFSNSFGDAVVEIAEKDPRVIAITAAMTEGTGLSKFAEKYPERLYDVGIAEPHAVTFAAGLAVQGLRPVLAIYSTFLQRAYDQIVHDVCLQKLPVIFAIDRAGIVGEDGATHHGVFDISYLRHIPNLTIMAPKNGIELKEMLKLAVKQETPSAIRFPRGNITDEMELMHRSSIEFGKSELLKEGDDLAILSVGHMTLPSIYAAKRLEKEGIHASVVNMRFLKPLDLDFISHLTERTKIIITVEENALAGGFGSSVLETLSSMGVMDVLVKSIGIPDNYIEHGRQDILRNLYGINDEGIYKTALSALESFHGNKKLS